MGTAAIVIIANVRQGKKPTARQGIAFAFVFAAIAGLATVNQRLATMFSGLVFVGVLMRMGIPAFRGVGVAVGDRSALVGAPLPVPAGGFADVTSQAGRPLPGGGSSNYVDQTPSPKASRAVRFARAQIGWPYVWGGESHAEGGFDCSGLCFAAYLSAGQRLPRTSSEQWRHNFKRVSWGHWAPGDLVFSNWPGESPSPGHVVMYAGDGQCVAAPHTGSHVQLQPVEEFRTHYIGSCRPAPGRASSLH